MGLLMWCAGETSLFEKSIAKPMEKRDFGNIAKTGAVRKGGLLRGKVSQGPTLVLRKLKAWFKLIKYMSPALLWAE